MCHFFKWYVVGGRTFSDLKWLTFFFVRDAQYMRMDCVFIWRIPMEPPFL